MKQIGCIFLFLPFCFLAQIPLNYYISAQGLTGPTLKVALHNIIKNHTVISYSNLWTAFQKTDANANAKVWDIYSYNASGPSPYEFTFVTNQCGNYTMEGDCYNREHSWPQSWFNGLAGPDSDLFHIYPTDGYVNNKRANYPYGNALLVSYTSLNGGKLGPCANPGYSLTVFEPIDEFKGDVARSYFYMTTRYFNEDSGWGSSDATSKSDILPWQINVLMQWHHLDPVSSKEIARNDSIYTFYQHNRNPFIDHPNWADSIWTYVAGVHENETDLEGSVSIYPNPSSDQFYIKSNIPTSDKINYSIQTITGEVIDQKTAIEMNSLIINTGNWTKGLYIITFSNKTSSTRLKLVKN